MLPALLLAGLLLPGLVPDGSKVVYKKGTCEPDIDENGQIAYKNDDGTIDPAGAIGLSIGAAVAVAAAVYLVYVLEILKWRSTPVVTLVRQRTTMLDGVQS